jgi:hypothetical protein
MKNIKKLYEVHINLKYLFFRRRIRQGAILKKRLLRAVISIYSRNKIREWFVHFFNEVNRKEIREVDFCRKKP